MKKLVATILVLGALISGAEINAKGTIDSPSEKPGMITQVTFLNVNQGAKLYFKDSDGLTLFTEIIESEGSYTKGFDLSGIPANEYYFELDRKGFITIYPLDVGNNSVTMLNELKTVIPKPMLKVEGDHVALSRNITQAQSLKVEIYYEGRELIYNETVDRDGKIDRRYDFSESISGEYLFNIHYEGRIHSEYVTVSTFY